MRNENPSAPVKQDLSDPRTWADIVREHYDRVLRTALAQTRHRALAEEIAQETFIRAFEKHDRFDGQGSLSSWLYRVTVNLARDVMRRENLRRHAELSTVAETPSPGLHPPDIVHRKHLCQTLKQALDQMAPQMKRAFEQTVILGYSYRQAAEIEGVSEGTIASRVARTRTLLAKKCRDLGLSSTGEHSEE
jgi:RNA polymerase sigma-70 factor (ECF subfamily)